MKKVSLKKGFLITYAVIGLAVISTAIGMSIYQNSQISASTSSDFTAVITGCRASGGQLKTGATTPCLGQCTSSTSSSGTTCAPLIAGYRYYCSCPAGKCFDKTTKSCQTGGSASATVVPSGTSTAACSTTRPTCSSGIATCKYDLAKKCTVCTCPHTPTPTVTATSTSTSTATAVPGVKATEVTLKANSFTAFNVASTYSGNDYAAGLEVCRNLTKCSQGQVSTADDSKCVTLAPTIFNYPKFGLYEWEQTLGTTGTAILPNLGYYGLNTYNEDIKLELCSRTTVPTNGQAVVLYPNDAGSWFLLGHNNPSTATTSFASTEVYFANSGSKTCNSITCSGKKTLSSLVSEGKIYDKVYEIIDPNGTDAATTFAIKDIATASFSGNNDYWIYVWPE